MKRKPSTPYNKSGSSKPFKRDDRQSGEKSDRPFRKSNDDRPARRDDKDGKPRFERKDAARGNSRPGEKSDRPFRKNDGDRPARAGRDERSDKPRFERKDGARGTFDKKEDRGDRPYRKSSEDRPRFEKRDSPSGDRKERGSFDRDRGEKPFRRNNDDRPARAGRDDRDDKPRFERKGEDRKERGSFDRDNNRGEKPFRRNNDDRPARAGRDDRDDKPRFERKGEDRKERGSFGGGDGKKSFSKPNRFERKDGDNKRPFDKDKKRSFEDRGSEDRPARTEKRGPKFEGKAGEERDARKKYTGDKAGRPSTKKRKDDEEDEVEKPEKTAYKTPHKYKRADAPQEPKPQASRRKRKFSDDDDDDEEQEEKGGPMPLNKYIAHSGECSRRDAAELVKQGKVKINGELVTDPGYRVQEEDKVTLLGKKLIPGKSREYILLNKPKGFITTTEDPQERKTVMDLVANSGVDRLYPVGRLDRNTTGLLLLTNDGDLAQKLSHPGYEVKKVYQVTLDKPLTKNDFQKIVDGLDLEDGKVSVDELAYLEAKNELGIQIHSGRNRIVRRIFESLGYEVEKLDRVIYAGLTKKNLPRSKWRFLREEEIILLKHFKS